MYDHFGLILNVNHACNLRCSYCYTGKKFNRPMPYPIGAKAIGRAIQSIHPGGTLELGFFGGEPLLEARMIRKLIAHARAACRDRNVALAMTMTTNGTVMTTDAVSVMSDPELQLTISCDGLPEIHDRHRRTADGAATSPVVVQTIQQLLQRGLAFHVNMVVRPDNISSLCSGVEYIRNLGVTHIDLALDLWTNWAQTDRLNLQKAIEKLAALWLEGLPTCGINWYDEQALKLSRIDVGQTARCGFGAGEIAVAPSGRMYPCERLMGEDAVDQPMRLAGHVSQGVDFLSVAEQPQRNDPSCDECAIHTACSTNCRCSNYVRTGDVSQPDRLLCDLNAACAAAIAARFWQPVSLTVSHQPEYAL